MLRKLAYGYVLLNVLVVARGTLRMSGSAALLNWIIVAVVCGILYARSPRMRDVTARMRRRLTARPADTRAAAEAVSL